MKFPSLVSGLFAASIAFAGQAHADEQNLQQQIDKLNQTIQSLEKQVKQNASTQQAAPEYTGPFSKVNFNGFASFGISKSSNEKQYFYGQDKTASVVPNTWLGFRFDTNLYSTGKVVAQFVAKADNDGDVKLNAEWLFLQQELGAGFNMQIGRIRFPANIDSEVMHIGNLYPTVRPMAEIYLDLSMNHLDGLSINHSMALGSWTLDTKLLIWAQGTDNRTNHPIQLSKMQGGVMSLSNTDLVMRAGLFTGIRELDIDEPVSAYLPNGIKAHLGTRMSYLTAALRYDNRQVFLQAEFLGTHAKGDRMEEIRNGDVLIGGYAGPVLIYTGYSVQRVSNKEDLSDALDKSLASVAINHPLYGSITMPAGKIFTPFFDRQQKAIHLGFKYDILPNVSLKSQLQFIYDLDNTHGDFDSLDDRWPTRSDAPNHVYVFDMAVQAYF